MFEGKSGEAIEGQQLPSTSPACLLCRSAASPKLRRKAGVLAGPGELINSLPSHRSDSADGSDLEGWQTALTRTAAAFLMVQTGWTHGRGRAVAGMLCRPQGACSVDTAPCFVKLGDATAGRIDRLGRAGFIMRRPLANAVVQPRKQGAMRASSWCDLDDCVWYVCPNV